jgi:hypothetical protein
LEVKSEENREEENAFSNRHSSYTFISPLTSFVSIGVYSWFLILNCHFQASFLEYHGGVGFSLLEIVVSKKS